MRNARVAQGDHVAALHRSVSAAAKARDAAAADVRALEYVSELTRDETARRRLGNQHLARAYSSGPSAHADDSVPGAVQRAEAALLLAKSELAALRLSIDDLHARHARAARTRATTRRRAAGSAIAAPHGARSPRNVRAADRLIADVDAIVTADGAHAPARVGVAPAGALALFGYGGAEPVRRFPLDALARAIPADLDVDDEHVLMHRMLAAPVQTASEDHVLRVTASVVGIEEALLATRHVINSTSAATRIVDEPLPPPSPRSPRRRH